MDTKVYKQLMTDLKSEVITHSDKTLQISDVAANQTPISPCAKGMEAWTQISVVMLITPLAPLTAASCHRKDSNKYQLVSMINYPYIQLIKGPTDHQVF